MVEVALMNNLKDFRDEKNKTRASIPCREIYEYSFIRKILRLSYDIDWVAYKRRKEYQNGEYK